MAVQILLPSGSTVWQLASLYDNLICVIFLIDFSMHMIVTPRKRDYFIGERGYLDLLGSIPTFGVLPLTALLRLFRISRLFRLRRVMNPENRKLLRDEILNNRGAYALFITILLVVVVLTSASILVLFFESRSPDANITTGGDAVWWGIVTITTVGYGDRYPVTPGGRVTAVFVMFAGVGIIGALASILASILVPQPKEIEAEVEDVGEPVPSARKLEQELQQLRSELIADFERESASVKGELAALRKLLEKPGEKA
jgi:voltage-gated potassium channel